MEKKYVSEWSKEEAVEVFHKNSELQTEIQSEFEDSEMHWVSEQLDSIRDSLSDWSIGSYSRNNYLEIGNHRSFLEGAQKMQSDYCTLGDDEAHLIDECVKAQEALDNCDTVEDDEKFEELEEVFEKSCEFLAVALKKQLVRILEATYEEEYQLDYFLNFYKDERLEQSSYILVNENGETDFTLYEDIAYTKKYS